MALDNLHNFSGKQFFMNKMGPAFMNDDKDNKDFQQMSSTSSGKVHNSSQKQQSIQSSGFRDVALSSLIPQVVAELLGMEYVHKQQLLQNNNNNNSNRDDDVEEVENLRMLRYAI